MADLSSLVVSAQLIQGRVPTQNDLVLAVSHAWSHQLHPDPLGLLEAVGSTDGSLDSLDRRTSTSGYDI